jgi:WhiB family transcriptional regulator, redox-sensing transcriptional regulator
MTSIRANVPRRGSEALDGARGVDWRSRGACVTEDPDLFFPVGSAGPAVRQIDRAKLVCHRCDVLDVCLRWAMETGQDAGVWGGLSENERRTLKRRRAHAGARSGD